MSKRFGLLTLLWLMLALIGTACSNFEQQNAALRQLLPTEEGYRYVYSGFAEYGHYLDLNTITTDGGQTLYSLNGMVDDPSGGEAPGPFDFTMSYRVAKGKLTRSVSAGSRLLDNRYPELELIRAPLAQGTSWKQKVTDKDGNKCDLVSTIVEVTNEDGRAVYRVRYEDAANSYWEERLIKAGVGVTAVELPYEDTTIGYSLYEAASGTASERQINALLPPFEQQMRYFGLAEYGHSGLLQLVSQTGEQKVVEFVGSFEDGSGIPGVFTVQYTLDYAAGTVTEQVTGNSRSGKPEVNSLMHDPIILKLPFEQGTAWEQQVTIAGKEYTMQAEIAEVDPDGTEYRPGGPIIRVKYRVEGVPGYFRDTYLEERVFQAGSGMIGFSKLIPGDIGVSEDEQNEQLVQEALSQWMFGYSQAPQE